MVGSRVYVGGLPYGVRERDLERFFKGYGRTRDILIKNGYGFVVSVFKFIELFDIIFGSVDNLHLKKKKKKCELIFGLYFFFFFCVIRNLKTIVMLTMLFTS